MKRSLRRKQHVEAKPTGASTKFSNRSTTSFNSVSSTPLKIETIHITLSSYTPPAQEELLDLPRDREDQVRSESDEKGGAGFSSCLELPTTDSFRTSLILPDLAKRFTLLRDADEEDIVVTASKSEEAHQEGSHSLRWEETEVETIERSASAERQTKDAKRYGVEALVAQLAKGSLASYDDSTILVDAPSMSRGSSLSSLNWGGLSSCVSPTSYEDSTCTSSDDGPSYPTTPDTSRFTYTPSTSAHASPSPVSHSRFSPTFSASSPSFHSTPSSPRVWSSNFSFTESELSSSVPATCGPRKPAGGFFGRLVGAGRNKKPVRIRDREIVVIPNSSPRPSTTELPSTAPLQLQLEPQQRVSYPKDVAADESELAYLRPTSWRASTAGGLPIDPSPRLQINDSTPKLLDFSPEQWQLRTPPMSSPLLSSPPPPPAPTTRPARPLSTSRSYRKSVPLHLIPEIEAEIASAAAARPATPRDGPRGGGSTPAGLLPALELRSSKTSTLYFSDAFLQDDSDSRRTSTGTTATVTAGLESPEVAGRLVSERARSSRLSGYPTSLFDLYEDEKWTGGDAPAVPSIPSHYGSSRPNLTNSRFSSYSTTETKAEDDTVAVQLAHHLRSQRRLTDQLSLASRRSFESSSAPSVDEVGDMSFVSEKRHTLRAEVVSRQSKALAAAAAAEVSVRGF